VANEPPEPQPSTDGNSRCASSIDHRRTVCQASASVLAKNIRFSRADFDNSVIGTRSCGTQLTFVLLQIIGKSPSAKYWIDAAQQMAAMAPTA
jgi:hypothetical protein